MRILVVEDQIQYVRYFCDELHSSFGHTVTAAESPQAAKEALAAGEFDVAIVDMLYETGQRGPSRTAWPAQLMSSGLSVVIDAAAVTTKVVIWTSGEANRQLHMIFAYEELGVRSFCSKKSGDGAAALNGAIMSIIREREWIDPILRSFLPAPGAPRLAQTILSVPTSKMAVWRALALGLHTREDIERFTGYKRSTVGNLVLEMFDDLVALNAGVHHPHRQPVRAKLNELVRYASGNHAFFLDHAVSQMYP